MQALLNDLWHFGRMLRRAPGFTITAAGSLALGIAACSAMFSVVNTVLFKPFGFSNPNGVVMFQNVFESGGHGGTASPTEFNWLREQADLVEDAAAYAFESANLSGQTFSEVVQAGRISGNYFKLSGAKPLVGRVILPADDVRGVSKVAVLAHGFWLRRFGADPRVIGNRVSLNGEPHEIIGIMRPDLERGQIAETVLGNGMLEIGEPPDVFLPFRIDPNSREHGHFFNVIGRLRPGFSLEAANARLRAGYRDYARAWPNDFPGRSGFRLQPVENAIVGEVRKPLLILFGAVSLVLLIACVNVASLLMVRATGRRREMAIRVAMGASRGRIIRQLLTESLMLSAAGSILGLAAGYAIIRFLLGLGAGNIPRIGMGGSQVSLDWRVAAFVLGLTLLTALLFGLVPAWEARRSSWSDNLKAGGAGSTASPSRRRARNFLVIAQTALALVLLTGAALLIRTFVALRDVNPGFEARNIVTMRTSFNGPPFDGTPAEVARAIKEGLRRLRLSPAVSAAAVTCCLPLEDRFGRTFRIAGRPVGEGSQGAAAWTIVTPDYFEAFEIKALRGRVFAEQDEQGPPSIVINQALARRYWPDGEPLKGQILIGREPARQVIGIVTDVRDKVLREEPVPNMYVLPGPTSGLGLPIPWAWVIRVRPGPAGIPAELVRSFQNDVKIATGGLPVARVRTMSQIRANSMAADSFSMYVLTIFACSGLLLAMTGIYGSMAFSVAQRTQEISMRIALGAAPGLIRNHVVFQGMKLALAGVVCGVAAAFGLTRVMAGFLFGVEPLDPLVFFSAPIILLGATLAAAWIPARRASRVDPMQALRRE